MPFTFFAHQAPVLPLARRWAWFDGTALCIGSMAPDLAYPLGPWMAHHSHQTAGLLAWAVPAGVIISGTVRRRVAPVAFAHFPEPGAIPVRDLGVIAAHRPSLPATALAVALGAVTHLALDEFTHARAFGTPSIGVDRTLVLGGRQVQLSWLLQTLGLTVGTLVGIVLLVAFLRSGTLRSRYGDAAVDAARARRPSRRSRLVFWSLVALGPPLGLLSQRSIGGLTVFHLFDATALTTLLACLLPVCRPR